MMKLLFVDTETTGLVNMRTPYTPETLANKWPNLTQIAWSVVEFDDSLTDYTVKEEHIYNIKPEYPESKYQADAESVTGLAYKFLVENGSDLRTVMDLFIKDLNSVDAVVAHNATFDMKMIKAEFLRLGIDQHMRVVPWIDTCYYGMFLCNTRMPNGRRKYPTLEEFYVCATGKQIKDAHSANGDVATLIEAFQGLCIIPVTDATNNGSSIMNPTRLKAIIDKHKESQKAQ